MNEHAAVARRPPRALRPQAGQPLRLFLFGALFLILGTVLVYIPAIRSGYIWDDDAYVHNNPILTGPHALSRIWLDRYATPQYYPLVFTTFWVEHSLWGMNPMGYHLVNALLHGLSAVLLWRVLRRLSIPGAFLAASIFAFHPVMVESVAWITERKNVLSCLCYLSSALLFLRFVDCKAANSAQRLRLYAASLLLFVCALLSKTTTASLPAALLLILAWKEKGLSKARVLAALPFFVCGIALGLQTAWLEKHHVGALGVEWSLRPLERILIASHALVFYAQKILIPLRLTFMYPRWELGPAAFRQLPYLIGLVALVATLVAARRRIGSGPLVAFLFFAGTLFPALGFFDVYPMRYSFVADHFQYLATLGPIALLAAAMTKLEAKWRMRRSAEPPTSESRTRGAGAALKGRLPGILAAASILAVLAGLTWNQQKDYRDVETLWLRTLEKNPRAWIAQVNLGTAAVLREDYETALVRFKKAIQIRPEEYNGHFNAGSVLNTLQRYEEALPYLERANQLFPGDPEAQYALGLAYLRTHRPGAAVAPFGAALRLRADWADPMNALAWVLSAYPDSAFWNPAAAVPLAERANVLAKGSDPYTLDTVAVAYGASGRYSEALEALKQARALLEASGDKETLKSLEEKWALYLAGKPYREIRSAGP